MTEHGVEHGISGVADAGAFLARLVRLEPSALVRLRPAGTSARTALWARLPWGVLVVRTVAGAGAGDVTVAAGRLLAELAAGGAALPARLDAQWRWALPPAASRRVETLPGAQVRRLAEAAAGTLREAAEHGVGGRAVGQRALRDALLDHVAVVVTPDEEPDRPVEVTQRMVQGLVRMGFLGMLADSPDQGGVQVRAAGRWVGLVGPYGAVWSQKATDLAVRPAVAHANG
ncbi:hypothetical protein SAMN05443287_1186 [Micromonospora phaseoli]|uniref:Uncharacterized protein n=1 Tax=Micromonospora phaseoli TaxID=1144548 RepID=A0A1H7DWS0_9ACTN|nr:hypothetical protein [Micromonospora phaseoli]PZV89229.1 hypothetical protein CLV64_11650 [Micromonospora phaseoli]GIJ80524.1 hypothetical protein Xph01_49560 [Micromonospora phaseoli]SEK05277.1 hypothetical protein SAMN05443287_1186 [Micromonospora phaseoli]